VFAECREQEVKIFSRLLLMFKKVEVEKKKRMNGKKKIE
jgi:hypothetical protein